MSICAEWINGGFDVLPTASSAVLFDGAPKRKPSILTAWSLGRWATVTALLEQTEASVPLGRRIVLAAKSLLSANSVGLAIRTDGFYSAIDGADDVARTLDELQFTVGQGPTTEALTAAVPIIVSDIESMSYVAGLGTFVTSAQEAGIRALMAFPLRVGAARVGVLTAYRAAPGWLTAEQYADGLVLASLATSLLLEEQARALQGDVSESFDVGWRHYAEVNLAAGILSERLNLSIDQALVVLRATAFANDVPVHELASQIVSGHTDVGE